ncbi:MAG: glycoside hydrolase family 43 protein [Gemmatimonadota bacterium]
MRRTRSGALLLFLGACAGKPTNPVEPPPVTASCTFTNPIAEGQDPWIVRHGDSYYLIQSKAREIWVYKSDRLTEPLKNGVRVWSAPATGWNARNIWAPELHFIDGRWYIYYAAGEAGPPFIYQLSGVLQSVADDPQGTYIDKGTLFTGNAPTADAENIWAIDVNVARLNGELYAVWSGWQQNATTDKTPQHLYIARMTNPWTLATARVKISSPVESWERGTELDINEGPQFLVNGDQVFIIYSARESWLPAYKMGQLRLASAHADPLVPSSWIKSGPVFTGTETVHGAGHGSFTVSPDGTESWIIYHSKIDTRPGWDRVIRLQKFEWANGAPVFGMPVASGTTVRVPSGQCAA